QAGLLEGADQAEADGVETTAEAGGSEEQSVHGFSLGELGAQTLEGGFGRGQQDETRRREAVGFRRLLSLRSAYGVARAQASSRARVSRAIWRSSLVGTTMMRGLPSAWISPATPRVQRAL